MQDLLQHIVHRSNKVVTKKRMSRLSGRIFSILLAFMVATSISFAQTYTNWILNGDVTNNGTIRVNRNIINNTTGLVTVSGTGVVKLQGNGAQTHSIQCTNISNTYPISIIRLDLVGSRITTLNTPTLVPTQLRIGDGTTAYTATGAGFSIGSQTLTIGNVSTYMATSTAALTFSGGTVNYTAASGAQTVLVGNTTTTYGTLGLVGNAGMTIPDVPAGAVSIATLVHSGTGTLTVNDSTSITVSGSIGTLATVASGKLLNFAGTSGSTIGTVTTIAGTLRNSAAQSLGITTVSGNAGTIENTSTGTLTIATLSANSGTITQSGTTPGAISFTNAATNTGTITNTSTGTITFNNTIANTTPGIISNTSTGTITFTNNLTATGTISQTTNGTINVGGSFTQNTYTLTGGTVVYNSGTAGQSVIGTIYNNLTLTSNSKTAAGAMTVNGNLSVSGGTFTDAGFQITGNATGNMSMAAGTGLTLGTAATGTSYPTNFTNAHISLDAASTVTYNSDQTQTVSSAPTYGNIVFSGTGMKTFTGSTTAAGNVTVNSGAQVTVNSVTVQINGDLSTTGSLTNNGTINIGN
jgi:hypothetical protein